MGGIVGLLMGLAGPLAARILIALGIGTVTFVGSLAALNAALASAKTAFGGFGTEVTALIAMAGGFTAVSIIAGGMVAALGLQTMKKFAMKATG